MFYQLHFLRHVSILFSFLLGQKGEPAAIQSYAGPAGPKGNTGFSGAPGSPGADGRPGE